MVKNKINNYIEFIFKICLAKPHNPMVNAGAIMVVSLIKVRCFESKLEFCYPFCNQFSERPKLSYVLFQSELRIADRFEFLTQKYKMMAGGEYIGFNIAT